MRDKREDTIAAVATAMSASGIGIVRISGPDAMRAADLVYRSMKGKTRLSQVPSHTIHYGTIIDTQSGALSYDPLRNNHRCRRTGDRRSSGECDACSEDLYGRRHR